jgi:hypothetical protein
MTQDLIEWIDNSFRTIPCRKGRALLGSSMGGYGVFRYGILHKEKFCALGAHAGAINIRDPFFMEESRQMLLQENQPNPTYYYDYYNTGYFTKAAFLLCAGFVPNLNTPQTYINPPIVEFDYDEQGNFIDTVIQKMIPNDIAHLIHILQPADSVGIYFGCGSEDEWFLYPGSIAFKDSLDLLGLPYEFYDHDGGHAMPSGFKQGALLFLDSLLLPPQSCINGINNKHVLNFEIRVNCSPNPVSDKCTIRFELAKPELVNIQFFNAIGEKVNNLKNKIYPSGLNKITWEASHFPEGVYFFSIHIGNETITKKIIKAN